MFCPNCGTPVSEAYQACPSCGTAVILQQPAAQMPMKWFKFLIYFFLWAGAVLTFITGMASIFGFQSGGMTDHAFAVYSVELFFVDMFYGILCIALGVFMIVTRFRLAGFRKNAPAMLYCVYALNTVIPFLNIIASAAVTMIPLSFYFDVQFISSCVISIAMIVINMIYFRKRREMFVC